MSGVLNSTLTRGWRKRGEEWSTRGKKKKEVEETRRKEQKRQEERRRRGKKSFLLSRVHFLSLLHLFLSRLHFPKMHVFFFSILRFFFCPVCHLLFFLPRFAFFCPCAFFFVPFLFFLSRNRKLVIPPTASDHVCPNTALQPRADNLLETCPLPHIDDTEYWETVDLHAGALDGRMDARTLRHKWAQCKRIKIVSS